MLGSVGTLMLMLMLGLEWQWEWEGGAWWMHMVFGEFLRWCFCCFWSMSVGLVVAKACCESGSNQGRKGV